MKSKDNSFNDETIKAIEDTNNNIDVKIHKTTKSLFKELGI